MPAKKEKTAEVEAKDTVVTDNKAPHKAGNDDNVQAQIIELKQNNEQIMSILKEVTAALGRQSARRSTDATEYESDIGAAEFTEDNELVMPTVVDPNNPLFKQKADTLAFMNEMVTIELHTTSERNAAQVVPLSVNGTHKIVMERGKPYRLRRFMVETLAMAQPIDYRNVEYTDDEGVKRTRYDASTGMRFPFSVIEDTPRGKEWFRRLTAPRAVKRVHV